MDDEAVAKVYEWLAKHVAEPDKLKLLQVALKNKNVKELIKEYFNSPSKEDSKETWSLLQETVLDRVQLMQEGAAALQGDEEEGDLAPGEDLLLDQESLDEPNKDEAVIEAFLDFFLFSNPKSMEMLRATSAYFGWLANQHPEVVQFREDVLGGKILTLNQAHKLLRSYAARFFPLEWFLDWGIPVVGHTSEIVGEYDWGSPRDKVDHRVTIRVDPPGITKRVRYAPPDTPIDEDRILTRSVPRSGEPIPPYSATLTSDDDHEVLGSSSTGNMGPALVRGLHTPTHPLYVWPGSVVDVIYTLSEELANTFRWPGRHAAQEPFRWWREDAAAEFVLTGIAPLMRPLEARLYEVDGGSSPQWRIELRISPWISAPEVVKAYRRMQNSIVEVKKRLPPPHLKAKLYKVDRYPSPQRRIELSISPWASAKEVSQAYKRTQKQVLGEGRNRLPDPKTLKVGRFVREQEMSNGYKRPKWGDLFEQWNKEYPEDRVKSHNNLCTYFERADKAVKELNFNWT